MIAASKRRAFGRSITHGSRGDYLWEMFRIKYFPHRSVDHGGKDEVPPIGSV